MSDAELADVIARTAALAAQKRGLPRLLTLAEQRYRQRRWERTEMAAWTIVRAILHGDRERKYLFPSPEAAKAVWDHVQRILATLQRSTGATNGPEGVQLPLRAEGPRPAGLYDLETDDVE